jgi:hypothetical protein
MKILIAKIRSVQVPSGQVCNSLFKCPNKPNASVQEGGEVLVMDDIQECMDVHYLGVH